MPSLRMKTKLATSSSKEKNGLHVCPNSSVISKSSLSRTRSVQNADEVADLIHNTHDVPSYYKVHPHQVGRNGDHANDLVDDLLEKQQPPVTDSANLDTMVLESVQESTVVICKPSSETIFSPGVEPVSGAHSESDIPSDGASNDFYVPQLETEDSDSSRSSNCCGGWSSSFLGSFVRASSPSKTTEFEKQAQLQTIQNKLKNKPKDCLSSRVSTSPSREKRSSRRSPSRSHKLRRRSRSRNRDKERHSRWSGNRDAYRSKRPHRSTSRSRSRSRDRDKHRQKEKQNTKRTRSVSPRDQRPGKVGKDRAAMVDYSKLIEGYQTTTPAERVKAKMKFQLSESVRKDETISMGSGWERFDFDKDAPLDDNEIEAVEDDGALVNHIGKSFLFSTVETRREEQIEAAHDEAIFGAPSLLPCSPSSETNDETEDKNVKKDISEIATATSLINGQALAMQQGSWRDRVRKS